MGWEDRGENEYYYSKVRRGKKVVSVYRGKGPIAALWDADTEQMKVIRQELWKSKRDLRARVQRRARLIESIMRPMFQSVEGDFNSAMIAAGCYRHHRQWRRRKGDRLNSDSFVVAYVPHISG
jgi:hypothetical protein